MSTITPTRQPIEIDLQPIGRRVTIQPGQTLLDAARLAGIELTAVCGGIGTCGSCRVKILQGDLDAPSLSELDILDSEELLDGVRLACQVTPRDSIRLYIPPESLTSPQQMQLEGQGETHIDHPPVELVEVEILPPNVKDLRDDLSRVEDFLHCRVVAGSQQITKLCVTLRVHHWKARLALLREGHSCRLAASLPPNTPAFGLAADLGSTKLAFFLVDLQSGATLAASGVMNPQIAFGEDVVSRIAFANRQPQNRRLLQKVLIDEINQAIQLFCGEEGISNQQIVDIVLVGNTAIHHLAVGLPVEQLGMAPYVPAVSRALTLQAESLGILASEGASVFMPPNIAGYVGADHVSALLAVQAANNSETTMLVDIGTNTEISLIHSGQIFSCSCASGPAFEGAHIHAGMRAMQGAVEKSKISTDSVRLTTIGHGPPLGICGSGILNIIADLREAGIINDRGVMDRHHPRVKANGRKTQFLLASAQETGTGQDLVITRQDINEIQLAKAAIRAGIDVLLSTAGLRYNDLQKFICAGAFGTYLDTACAIRIGMFPPIALERFHQVGNAAGVGARQMLLSAAKREQAEQLRQNVQYIELTSHPGFRDLYVDHMTFP